MSSAVKLKSGWVLDAPILHLMLTGCPSSSFCRGWASSACSPLCWGSATCPRWATWTDDAPGTPSQPGSLAPLSCSGTRQEREDAFALSIVPALCPLSGGCRTCGLLEMTKATGCNSAHTGHWKESSLQGARSVKFPLLQARQRVDGEKGQRTRLL